MRLPKLGKDLRYRLEAKTAYGLLSTVIAIVKHDARTMEMGTWGGQPGNAREMVYANDNQRPVCGTVGCIGGWIDHLTFGEAGDTGFKLGFSRYEPEDADAIEDLFYGDLCMDPQQGTRKHANRVISLIKKFQRKHRARLLATKVKVARAR